MICPDCTLENCSAKPIYDLGGTVLHMEWRCTRCGNQWLVPVRLPWYRRLWSWLACPIIHD